MEDTIISKERNRRGLGGSLRSNSFVNLVNAEDCTHFWVSSDVKEARMGQKSRFCSLNGF
jgi:hypothetical protein